MVDIKSLKEYTFSYNKMIFHEFLFKNLKVGCKNSDNIRFEQFDLDDIDVLSDEIDRMDFISEFTIPDTLERLKKGYFLFVAKRDRRIIGFLWLATGSYLIPYFDSTVYLEPNEVYSINGYVNKSFRGKNILNMIKAYAYDNLKKRGYYRAIGSYYTWNKASHRMNIKFGSVPLGYLIFGYVLSVRYLIGKVPSTKIITHSGPLYAWKKFLSQKARSS